MAKQLRPSQLEALLSGDLNGNEFFALHRIGYNYSLTLGELKKYLGTGGSGGGSDIDLTSVPSNIIPDSNGSRILGNAENAWKRLFLTDSIRFTSNGIIYGNVDVQGALTLNGKALAMQSSITHISGIVNDIDARLGKIESAGGVDLSDYYTKDNVDDILKNYTPTSVLQTDYVSVRGDHTITGTHTYNDGKLKVGQYAFGTSSSGLTIDGGLIQTSLNSYTNSDIDNMIASMATAGKLGGMLNITDKTAIQNAQKSLTSTNQVVYYIITDSSGKLPSKQTCFDLSADNIKQLSLTSPNALTNATLSLVHGRVAVSPIGVNVGDMIALTRVKVKVSDLTEALGISLSLSGEIEMYQYRIISFNDAKAPNTNGITNGVMGLMTPSDKAEVSKIGGIEWTVNHVRDNYLPKADLLPSIWGTNMNDCLATGVYPWCTLGRPSGSIGAYTCIVKRTSTNDGSYDTIEQTAYGRQEELGRVFKRIIFYRTDGGDTQYGDWIELGGSNSDYLTKAQADGYYLSKSGNGTVSGNLGVGGSLYGAYAVFSYTSGDGLYMSDNSINAHNKGSWTRQLFKFDKTNGRVEINNGFETDVTSYIGSASNVNYKALIFRRNGNGFRLNATNDAAYFSYGPLNSAKDEITPNAVVYFNGSGFKYSPDAVNYHDVLTSNSLKIGEYAFQDRTENRLAASTNLDNVSYGVWGTLDNTAYTNAPIQNFGLIVSRLNQLYKGQLILPYSSGHLQYRAQLYNNGKVEWSGWRTLAFTDDIPSVVGFLKEGFSINNATITTLTASTIKYTGGTSSSYWELNNQGGGAGNRPAFTKNLQIKDGSTYYENVHSGNISSYAITKHQDISGKADKSGYTANRVLISNSNTTLTTSTISVTELGQLSGVTGNIQTQINGLKSLAAKELPSFRDKISGSTHGHLNIRFSAYNPNEVTTTSAIYYSVDNNCFLFVIAPEVIGLQGRTTNAYSIFPNSDFYNSSSTQARSGSLFYNEAEKCIQRIEGTSLVTIVDSSNISSYGFATQQWADNRYLSKTNAIQFGGTATFKNANALFWMDSSGSGAHTAMSVNASNQLLIGYGTSQASMPTFIDGYEVYLRYGTAHTTGVKINSNGVVDVYSSLRVGNTSLGNGTSSIHIYRNSYNVPYIRFSAKNAQGVDFTCGEIGVSQVTGFPVYWNTVNDSTAWKNFITEDNIGDYALPKTGGTVDYITTSKLNGYALTGSSSGLKLSSNFDANALSENGTLIANKYLSKDSDTVKGTLTFNGTSDYHLREASTTPKWYIGKNGYATFAYVANTSDANMKNLMGDVNLSVKQIANAPAKYFTWKNNIQLGRQVGTVAQYWKDVLPEVVMENEGLLGLNYASLAVVLSIILARITETHEQRIAWLEKLIATLTDKLNSLAGKA